MKKKLKKVMSLMISLATAATLNVAILSNNAQNLMAAENDSDTCKSIQFDHSVLSRGSDTKDAPYVYFGDFGDNLKTAVPYRVIAYNGRGCVSMDASYRAVSLFSDIAIFPSKFNDNPEKLNAYYDSTLKHAVDNYIDRGLFEQERVAILPKDLPVSLYTPNYGCGGVAGGMPVWDQLMWPLSTGEAYGLPVELRTKDTVLCSPGKPDDPNSINVPNKLVACIRNTETEKGVIVNDGESIENMFNVRLGVSVRFKNILMVTSVEEGKGKISGETGPDALTEVQDYDISGIPSWKLTLTDGSRNTFKASLNGSDTVNAGKKISINYENAKAGENEFVSVILTDAENPDQALYYGRIVNNSESGTAEVKIPSGLRGNYIMKVYSEQYNGAKRTDLASNFQNINITVVQSASITEKPVASEGLVYNGKSQDLISEGNAVNGTMMYKLGEDGTYAESIPSAKDAGEYTIFYKAAAASGYVDSKEYSVTTTIAKAPVTVTPNNIVKEIGKEDPSLTATVNGLADGDNEDMITYTISRVAGEDEGIYQINTDGNKDQGNYEVTFGTGAFTIEEGTIVYTISDNMKGSYNIGCKQDLVITVKRNVNDQKTFENYKGSTMDDKEITKEQGTAAKGSLILTLKSSYLDTLSEGEHKIKVSFVDGEAVATINVGKVQGKSLPKTGDTSKDKTPLAMMLIISSIAGIAVVGMKSKKREE